MDRLWLLKDSIEKLYLEKGQHLLFHGWHHVQFVFQKCGEFADYLKVDRFLVESAALCHDINHIIDPNSETEDGEKLRAEYLMQAGYTTDEIAKIESIVQEAGIDGRTANISLEAQALSDADTLFKSLPVTPLIFTSRYIQEKHSDIKKLATSIVAKQQKVIDAGIYFYTDLANQKYLAWAKTNLHLWNNVVAAIDDEAVQTMLKTADRLLNS